MSRTVEREVGMHVENVDGLPIVRVEGDLDAENAGVFQQTLQDAAEGHDGSARQVVIDLEHCPYIDSAGLGVLFTVASWARQGGGGIAAVRPSLQVLRILQLVRLTDERGFQVFSDLESAQHALKAT